MKKLLLSSLFSLCFFNNGFANLQVNEMKKLIGSSANLQAGVGYSEAKQQVNALKCFQTTDPIYTESLFSHLSSSMTFEDLQETVNVNLSFDNNIFSGSSLSEYLNLIQDTDLSISINFYQDKKQVVSFQPYGLTELGKSIYNNKSDNFDMFCGNNYITQYTQGAFFIVSIIINFENEFEKKYFSENSSLIYGYSMDSLMTSIQEVVTKNNINANISFLAFQLGGDVRKIGDIISQNGFYCSLKDITACEDNVKQTINYSENIFPKQITLNDKKLTGMVSNFPINVESDISSIQEIGLTLAPSLATPEVIADRNKLINSYKENLYYKNNFNALLKRNYPVSWDFNSETYNNIKNLYQKASNNIDVLLGQNSNMEGINNCYIEPDKCVSITNDIEAVLNPITQEDLDSIKDALYSYTVPGVSGYFIYDGSSWNNMFVDKSQGNYILSINSLSLNKNSVSYEVSAHFTQVNSKDYNWYGNGTSSDGVKYTGEVSTPATGWKENNVTSFELVKGPFYFPLYSNK